MTDPTRPKAWANLLVALWGQRFPVGVRLIAQDYSRRFADPVSAVKPADVDDFEGALFPLNKKRSWAILYNPNIRSKGRINFTIAHELGHYLVHRAMRPSGFECGQARVLGFDQDETSRVIEREADDFASYLLMPMDDFRAQVSGQDISLALLEHCSDRYETSFTATALKWLEFTEKPAALVVSRDGFILWASRSIAAKRQGIFYPRGMPLPHESLANRQLSCLARKDVAQDVPSGVWSSRPTRETVITSDRYDLTISLVEFGEITRLLAFEEEPTEDVLDVFERRESGRLS